MTTALLLSLAFGSGTSGRAGGGEGGQGGRGGGHGGGHDGNKAGSGASVVMMTGVMTLFPMILAGTLFAMVWTVLF